MLSQKFFKRVLLVQALLIAVSAQLFAGQGDLSTQPGLNSPPGNNSQMYYFNGADSVVFQNDSTFTIEGVKEELSSEGEWIKVTKNDIDPEAVADQSGGFDPEINTDFVWRPYNVDPEWSPYTNGYWQYTNCGWMWVSYYSFGWRTCHYGRWWWSPVWGWVWSPGFIWAPAWVVWMYNDGYCGWYPISPWCRWHHGYGWQCHNMRYKVRCWTFVEKRVFADPIPPIRPIVDPYKQTEIIKNSLYEVNPKISVGGVNTGGPNVSDVEKKIGKKVSVDNVTNLNNVKNYTGNKTDDDIKKVKDDNRTKNNTGVVNENGKNNDVTKNNDVGKNNEVGKNNDVGKKNENNTGTSNDGWKRKDENNTGSNNNGNNNTGNNNTGNNNNTGRSDEGWNGNNEKKNNNEKKYNEKKSDDNVNQYTPPPQNTPPQYTPPKNDPPKQTPPQNDPPKIDPPKDNNSGKNNDSNNGSNDNGKKK